MVGVSHRTASFPVVAVVEWVDVAAIMVWFCIYASKEIPTQRLAFVSAVLADTPSKGGRVTMRNTKFFSSSDNVHMFFDASVISIAATVVYVGTMLATWYTAVKHGIVPAGTLPDISDLWWSPPGAVVYVYGAVVLQYVFIWVMVFAKRNTVQ